MAAYAELPQDPVESLNREFLSRFPVDAARQLESMSPREISHVLADMPTPVLVRVLEKVTPGALETIVMELSGEQVASLLESLSISVSVPLLSRLDDDRVDRYLALLTEGAASELKGLLSFPDNSAGRLMNPRIVAFNHAIRVDNALEQLKAQGMTTIRHLFLLNDEMQLLSQVDVRKLPLADGNALLSDLAVPVTTFVHAMDPKDEVMEKLDKNRVDVLHVVDVDQRLVGTIQGQGILDAMREDLVADLQTMVGASKDERALSSSLFAVRKRLPWLQINLLTAFLAAGVVGLFEDTIAQFTALAVLLPIAAGQSGNTGAQALAVTMRVLSLREITLRDWFRVVSKELAAGLINGIGIAVVCATGVYLWSGSTGLALVMALAMVISMTLAGASGALVPIVLKRFGQDPAQSSSIVLTTVTDIAGFMSFLGIATLLSGMLAAG